MPLLPLRDISMALFVFFYKFHTYFYSTEGVYLYFFCFTRNCLYHLNFSTIHSNFVRMAEATTAVVPQGFVHDTQKRVLSAIRALVPSVPVSFEHLCDLASCVATDSETALAFIRIAFSLNDDELFRFAFEGLVRAAAPCVRGLGDFLEFIRLAIWGSECLRYVPPRAQKKRALWRSRAQESLVCRCHACATGIATTAWMCTRPYCRWSRKRCSERGSSTPLDYVTPSWKFGKPLGASVAITRH